MYMLILSYVFLFTGLTVTTASKADKYVHNEDVSYKRFLSTKTPYRFVGNTDDSEMEYEGCSATKIWAVFRHGTRTPGPGTTEAAHKRLSEIRDAIVRNNKKPGKVANWEPHHELDDKKRLTRMGQEEMVHLGGRFRNRFSSVFPETWNNETFVVRATDTTRALDSAKHFLIGLFGEKEAQRVWMPAPLKKDPVLRFYKLCPRWREQVKKNPETKKEVENFLRGKLFSNVVENVTDKCNLPRGYLDADDVQLMYTMCCFETSWDRQNKSAWCKMFDKDDFKILEYAEDMEYFWIDGFGNPLTTQIACPMFQNAFSHLNDDHKEPFVFYFTHSGTILKFLTHLGLYRDEHDLLSNNFDKQDKRNWRTSKIDSFATNIAFVRYDCINGEKYILTLHQERPIRLPGCPKKTDLCSLDTIKRLYRNSLEECNYDSMCNVNDTNNNNNKNTRDNNNDNKSYWSALVDSIWELYNTFHKLYY